MCPFGGSLLGVSDLTHGELLRGWIRAKAQIEWDEQQGLRRQAAWRSESNPNRHIDVAVGSTVSMGRALRRGTLGSKQQGDVGFSYARLFGRKRWKVMLDHISRWFRDGLVKLRQGRSGSGPPPPPPQLSVPEQPGSFPVRQCPMGPPPVPGAGG
jgi:hypothetical protein